MQIKRTLTFVDEVATEAGQPVDPPLRKVAVVAIIDNPFAGRFERDLEPADQGERRDRPPHLQDRDRAARPAQARELRQGRGHRHERRAGAWRRDADDRVRQRDARRGRRRQGLDFVVHQARRAGRNASTSRSRTRMRSTCARTTTASPSRCPTRRCRTRSR